jgi:hypothetical protein
VKFICAEFVFVSALSGFDGTARDCDLIVIGSVANDPAIKTTAVAQRIPLNEGRTTDLKSRIHAEFE